MFAEKHGGCQRMAVKNTGGTNARKDHENGLGRGNQACEVDRR
jgi:hypothetical protein